MAAYKDLPPLINSPGLQEKVQIAIDLRIRDMVADLANPSPTSPHLGEPHVQAWARLAYISRAKIRSQVTGAVIIENRNATVDQIKTADDTVIKNQVAAIVNKFLSKQLWPTDSVQTRDTSPEGLST